MNKVKILDLRGLFCPLPLVATIKEVSNMKSEEIVEILITDRSSCDSISEWAERNGHEIQVKYMNNYIKLVLKVK